MLRVHQRVLMGEIPQQVVEGMLGCMQPREGAGLLQLFEEEV